MSQRKRRSLAIGNAADDDVENICDAMAATKVTGRKSKVRRRDTMTSEMIITETQKRGVSDEENNWKKMEEQLNSEKKKLTIKLKRAKRRKSVKILMSWDCDCA